MPVEEIPILEDIPINEIFFALIKNQDIYNHAEDYSSDVISRYFNFFKILANHLKIEIFYPDNVDLYERFRFGYDWIVAIGSEEFGY